MKKALGYLKKSKNEFEVRDAYIYIKNQNL